MQTKQIKAIIANLKYQLSVMKNKGEVMDKASWLMKMGVILSGEDAEILIKYLNENIK
jgi:hypothetical protein